MATFCYRIRSTQKNKLVKVQILFTVGRGNQFYVDSQYLILTDAWDSKRQSIKSRYTFTDDFTEQQGRELTKNLSELRSFILGEMAKDPEHAMTKTKLEKIVYSFHHPRSASGGHDIRSRESLTDYMARYTREMEAGTRLNIHKLRYGASTIKNYKGFIIQFDEFCKAKRKRFDFGDIDLKFYDDFVAWFTTKDYSINTIGRHVKELKIIMRAAREEGLHEPQIPRTDRRCREYLSYRIGNPCYCRPRLIEQQTQRYCPRYILGRLLYGTAIQRLLDHQRGQYPHVGKWAAGH